MKVSITVNGKKSEHDVEPRTLLVHYIREIANLTGTNIGGDTSSCGACTIHLDGEAVKSCTILAAQADGCSITTIEGLTLKNDHPLQKLWVEMNVAQCGYCQSGMLMAAAALLKKNPNPTDADIDAQVNNICRCGTYPRVRAAIHKAAKSAKSAKA